jgi:hypothetical protein
MDTSAARPRRVLAVMTVFDPPEMADTSTAISWCCRTTGAFSRH